MDAEPLADEREIWTPNREHSGAELEAVASVCIYASKRLTSFESCPSLSQSLRPVQVIAQNYRFRDTAMRR